LQRVGAIPELAVIDMMFDLRVDGVRTATELARQHGLKFRSRP
jgi:hypothetical protein